MLSRVKVQIVFAVRYRIVTTEPAGDEETHPRSLRAQVIARRWRLRITECVKTAPDDPRETTAGNGQRLMEAQSGWLGSFPAELATSEKDEKFPY